MDATSCHISGCDFCSREVEETGSLLSRLESLPEITPSPAVWNRLEKEVSVTTHRSGVWLPLSMAAALLIASFAAFFVFVPGQKQVAAVAADHSSIYVGEEFSASKFTELSIPDVGSLLVRKGSEIRFMEPRILVLIRGEVFADVIPSGKGFEIHQGHTRVIVYGTRFGVKAGEAVYVLEGRVRVIGLGGDLDLRSGGAASLLPGLLHDGLAQIDLSWIPAPELAITLKLEGGAGIRRGDELIWKVAFSSSRPFLLENLKRVHGPDHYLFLKVEQAGQESYLLPVDPVNILSSDVGPGRIGPGRNAVLKFRIDSRKFRMDGRHSIFAIYTGKGTKDGQVTSKRVKIEVER